MSSAIRPPRRPGGRSARVQDAIYSAVGTLVGAGGAEGISIPQVAQEAGVNPSSIYRRWGTIEALMEQVAVAALVRDDDDAPDTGSISGDLQVWAGIIAADIRRPERITYLRAMVAARQGLVASCPCWETRRRQATRMIALAAARGETAPGVDQIMQHVIAPLYHHAVFGLVIDDNCADNLVRDVLAMSNLAATTG